MENKSYAVPTEAAYGGEPQYVQTSYGIVRNDATYKKYLAEKERQKGLMENSDMQIGTQTDYSLYGNGFSKEYIDEMNNDTKFYKALNKYVILNEGGYVNHPNDRGKATKFGVSSRWYPNEDIPNLTRERANMIFYDDYWIKPKINLLPDELAYRVFDNAIVQGQPTAIKNLQRAVGVKADGLIGPDTLNAVNSQDYDTIRQRFIENVHQIEDEYQRNDPTQKVFERGHRDRYNRY